MRLQPVEQDLLFSKNDPLDPRLGERVRPGFATDLTNATVAIWGAPDDEGIHLNGGRPGAALAPREIRRFLYKMTPPPRGPFPTSWVDLGNLTPGRPLVERHDQARSLARAVHEKGAFALSLGGGHDYGFPDGAGFLDVTRGQRPLVINFDAHLDVRPATASFHSGTPFRRLLEAFPGEFEFWELGLQPQCNAKAHVEWAEAQGAQLLFLEDMEKTTPETLWPDADPRRPCWLSLDLDVFSSKEAPGCSQSWATGLLVDRLLPWLEFFVRHFDVRGLGLYEVSPALDTDHRTSKLAALVAFHALRFRALKGEMT